jgi:rRNA maturation endonuclease Nob1
MNAQYRLHGKFVSRKMYMRSMNMKELQHNKKHKVDSQAVAKNEAPSIHPARTVSTPTTTVIKEIASQIVSMLFGEQSAGKSDLTSSSMNSVHSVSIFLNRLF